MKIASLILLVLGCILLIIALLYGKKHAIRNVQKEYKLITSGARMKMADAAQGSGYDARAAAQDVYKSLESRSKETEKDVKLSPKEKASLSKAEDRVIKAREEYLTSLLQVDQKPDSQVDFPEENTEILLEEKTILLDEIEPNDLEEDTVLLEDDKTEILLEKKEERKK